VFSAGLCLGVLIQCLTDKQLYITHAAQRSRRAPLHAQRKGKGKGTEREAVDGECGGRHAISPER